METVPSQIVLQPHAQTHVNVFWAMSTSLETEVHLSYSVNPFKATGPMITVNDRTSWITSMLASYPALPLSPVFGHLYNVQKLEMGRPENEA